VVGNIRSLENKKQSQDREGTKELPETNEVRVAAAKKPLQLFSTRHGMPKGGGSSRGRQVAEKRGMRGYGKKRKSNRISQQKGKGGIPRVQRRAANDKTKVLLTSMERGA